MAKKITNSLRYAKRKGIEPADLSTWDPTYKERQQILAGIKKIEEDVKSLKKLIAPSKKKKKKK